MIMYCKCGHAITVDRIENDQGQTVLFRKSDRIQGEPIDKCPECSRPMPDGLLNSDGGSDDRLSMLPASMMQL